MQGSHPTSDERQKAATASTNPFFKMAHDPLCLLDSRGRVREINSAFSRLLGYRPAEARGVAFLEWVHPQERKMCVAVLGAAVASQQVTSFDARLRDHTGAYRATSWKVIGQGGELYLAAQQTLVSLAASGTTDAVLALVEAAPDFIGLADAGGMTVYLNRTGREWLGYGPDYDLSAVHISAYLLERERHRLEQEGLPAVRSRGTWVAETALRAGEGEERPVSLVITAQRDETGTVQRFAIIARDFSDVNRAQALTSEQAAKLEAAAEISVASAMTLEIDRMLQEVVDVTSQRFDLYHVQIYLLDSAGEALELASGSGAVGRELAKERQRIDRDEMHSLVAQAARQRRGVVANDVEEDEQFESHPLLPETRSALAVPMLAAAELVGVLHILNDTPGRFDATDVNVFVALASQVAVAVENARSFAQAQAAVAESTALMRRLTREGWEGYLREQSPLGTARGFLLDGGRVSPALPSESEPPAHERDGKGVLLEPLQIQDEVIGQLMLLAAESAFDEEDAGLVAAVAGQLSARIENLRLTAETQLALTETAALYRAGTDLNRARDYDEVLDVMRLHSVAGRDASAMMLVLFDTPWEPESPPTRLDVAANWFAFDTTGEAQTFPAGQLRAAAQLIDPDALTFIADLEQVETVAATLRRYLAGSLHGKSALFVPLVVGGQWIGYLATTYREAASLSIAERQRLTTLAGQASVAIQSISLFEAAQERAREERILREVSTRVRGVTDVDLIMRTAVREIGQALGRETFLYLGEEEKAAVDASGEQAGQGGE